jgi:serine/threonine-protein kinase
MPSSSWVRPKQPPNDEVEVFGLGEPDAEDDTGDILGGRYELLEVLACGATATVYRARDRTTRSVVAVKVLYKGALAAVGEFFSQEARLAARIRSPHLVHASDFGEDEGRPYIVFDLVPGDALAELYSERLMPWRELCVVVLDLLAALDELHRRGITHRDVKPDNVFVVRTLGDHVHVTLLDLGFAAVPPERRITGAPEPSRKVFGTFGFIAPELLAGALPEPRCDLYSVGALMYKMLTGQLVPDLRAAPALICIPAPRVFVPTLPEAVDALVMRALSDVEARFQSAAEMAAAIRAALAGADSAVPRDTPAVLPPAAEGTTRASGAAAVQPTSDPPVTPVDDELRPFRDAPAMATMLPDGGAPAGDPAPAASSAPSTIEPGGARPAPRARTKLAVVALGGGLLGAALMWGLMRPYEPLEQPAARTIAAAAPPTPPILSPIFPAAALPASSAASPASSPISPTAPPTPAPVVASIGPPSASPAQSGEARPGARKKPPLRAETFAQVMSRLEPKIRECARMAELPEAATTVQIRSNPATGAIESVRVLRMSSQHPFAVCADETIRRAALPLNISPIEDFTFFRSRGQAAK